MEKTAGERKKKILFIIVWLLLIIACGVCSLLVGSKEKDESISDVMKDAVLHDTGKISLFGIMDVNPALVSGFIVTAALLIFCAIVRIFVIPRFKYVPGKFQSFIEMVVSMFDNQAKVNSPARNGFLGAYTFAAGAYIFIGTLFELLGVQAVSITGNPISLPAPLSDINGAIAIGCLSYLVIMSGGIAGNGVKGIGLTLKDFSLPVSMSFRLFGALLSGLLVNELVYYYLQLSFVLPVAVGVMFTLLHALIQAYVLTMLTALFYGEVSQPRIKTKK